MVYALFNDVLAVSLRRTVAEILAPSCPRKSPKRWRLKTKTKKEVPVKQKKEVSVFDLFYKAAPASPSRLIIRICERNFIC